MSYLQFEFIADLVESIEEVESAQTMETNEAEILVDNNDNDQDDNGQTTSDVPRSGGNESFKENPYTFLSSDNPILIASMCVVY